MAKSSGNLSLNSELKALDSKNRLFRQNLSDEDRKKFSPYLMLRYAASVEGSSDLQAYYLMATNENVNKNFFDLDAEMQWLSCTTVSPDLGSQRHYWHSVSKAKTSEEKYWSKLLDLVESFLDGWKRSDVETWCKVNGVAAVEQWILAHGAELPKKK
jgi:hypothetical protein